MTNDEKLDRLKALISPDTANNDLLMVLLQQSEGIVLTNVIPSDLPPMRR